MLKRITSALFEGKTNDLVELAVVAQNNNGVEAARFQYDGTTVPARVVQGHPGAAFDVLPGIHQLRVVVVFDPAAPSTARYDLFQVNDAGTLEPLGKSVKASASAPLIGFGIDGVAVMMAAKRARKRAKRKAATKRTKARTAKTATKRTKTKKATRATKDTKHTKVKTATKARKGKTARKATKGTKGTKAKSGRRATARKVRARR